MNVIDDFPLGRILCIGDIMIDRFIGGDVRRISPESPVPVLLIESNELRLGGAANVARNIAALGGQCTLVGVIGDDESGTLLQVVMDDVKGIVARLLVENGRPTTEKIRFIAGGQHMLRADRETNRPISPASEEAILAVVAGLIDQHAVIVLSDYAKGVLTDRIVAGTIEVARQYGRPVIVDPKSSIFSRYAGATIVTPNIREVGEATGIDAVTDEGAVEAGHRALSLAGTDAVLLTRAERGMTLIEADHLAVHIRATAREVFDVVGAGDTVVATLALAIAAGQTLAEAAFMANAAAGVVVGKRGTAVVTPAELHRAISQAPHEAYSARDKVLSIDDAIAQVAAWKQQGHKVGFTNGCFDILHAGHIQLIDFAREHSGRLVIGLNADSSVSRLKGTSRPVNPQADRALLLASLSNVDAVVLFDEDTPRGLIAALLPDILIKGADYVVEQIAGADLVLQNGGQVLLCELLPGRSTTRILETGKLAT